MRLNISARRKRFNFLILVSGQAVIAIHVIAFGALGFIDVSWSRGIVWQSLFSCLMLYFFIMQTVILYDNMRADTIDVDDRPSALDKDKI